MEKNATANLSLEETIEQRRKEIEAIYAENPPGDGVQKDWWLPFTIFTFHVNNDMSKEARDELDKIFKKIIDSDFDPSIAKAAFEEARGCFEGHDELLRQHDELASKMDAKLLDHTRNTWRLMREDKANATQSGMK